MMTILPQNSILSKVNSVTVDAEKFAKLNGINDEKLREALGKAFGKLVNSYIKNVINEQNYTLGQALEVIELCAAEISAFTQIETDEEYDPKHFQPDGGIEQTPENISGAPAETPSEPKRVITADERKKMLFNSFNRKH